MITKSGIFTSGIARGEDITLVFMIFYLLKVIFLCPQRNFGRHIVIALSVRPSVRPSRFRVRSISPIFFEVGIPNEVCGCILDGGVSRTIFGSL